MEAEELGSVLDAMFTLYAATLKPETKPLVEHLTGAITGSLDEDISLDELEPNIIQILRRPEVQTFFEEEGVRRGDGTSAVIGDVADHLTNIADLSAIKLVANFNKKVEQHVEQGGGIELPAANQALLAEGRSRYEKKVFSIFVSYSILYLKVKAC